MLKTNFGAKTDSSTDAARESEESHENKKT